MTAKKNRLINTDFDIEFCYRGWYKKFMFETKTKGKYNLLWSLSPDCGNCQIVQGNTVDTQFDP